MITLATNNLTLGLVTGLITFTITFPLAQQVLPFFIRESDDTIRNYLFKSTVNFPGNWHKYFLGMLYTIFLLLIEYILLVGVSSLIMSSGVELI